LIISSVDKPEEKKNILIGTGLTTIKEEKLESSGTVTPSIISSTPQNTGGFFGSVNTLSNSSGLFGSANPSSQSSGLFTGELFGKKQAQNETNLGYNSTDNITSQPK
jgi:hypothetical protein